MLSALVTRTIRNHFKKTFPKRKFLPGVTPVPISGKVFDEHEMVHGVESVLDGWWTEGRFAQEFEKKFGAYLGVRYVSLVNSGSSANLLALTALTNGVFGNKTLRPGDEVITVATSFPTTVNPILQNRCTAVLLDNDLVTKNVDPKDLKMAITKKTKAIMMAHTLGNPMPVDEILAIVRKHDLWFIEDSCDALGGVYKGKKLGSFGHIATFSFYPAHQITMGEGGAVVTSNPLIHRSIRQFRDWGRDCWCDTGHDDTCHRRFGWKLGDLPEGYDHKYIYSQIGYNLKLTDMQAAIGCAQLDKLPSFTEQRRVTYRKYDDLFRRYPNYFILTRADHDAQPSWFGFPIVITESAPFSKNEFVAYLEAHKIATRAIFAGNIIKHPAYMNRTDIRISGILSHSDMIMRNGFWIGVYPGITARMSDYVIRICREFIQATEDGKKIT